MLLPTLLSTTALALTASAFLVPLEVADKAITAKVEALKTFIHPSSQSVKLDCSTCPYAINSTRNLHHEWTNGVKNDLIMDFSIKNNQLNLNSVPILKADGLGMTPLPPTQPMKVHQVAQKSEVDSHDKEWVPYDGELRMSFSVQITRSQAFESDPKAIFHSVEVQVLGLDAEVVNPDAVVVNLVKKSSGEVKSHALPCSPPEPISTNNSSQLCIQSISTHPVALSPASAKCKNIMCRVMHLIVSKIQAARTKAINAAKAIKGGCMRKFGSKSSPKGTSSHSGFKLHGGPPKFAGKFQPGDHRDKEHGHPNHRHGISMVLHAINRVFKHVVLPVLIGVAAGMAASAVGMLVGHLIVYLWVKYRRGGKGSYERVEQVEEGMGDGLPKYEELEGTEVEAEYLDEKKEVV